LYWVISSRIKFSSKRVPLPARCAWPRTSSSCGSRDRVDNRSSHVFYVNRACDRSLCRLALSPPGYLKALKNRYSLIAVIRCLKLPLQSGLTPSLGLNATIKACNTRLAKFLLLLGDVVEFFCKPTGLLRWL